MLAIVGANNHYAGFSPGTIIICNINTKYVYFDYQNNYLSCDAAPVY